MYTESELLAINPKDFNNRVLSKSEILEFFYSCNAAWLHNGDASSPHAELSSELCSNGYFNCREVLKHPNVCEVLAKQLYRKIKVLMQKSGENSVDWVIGSPYSAITFSYELAKIFRARHGFVEKGISDGGQDRMVWKGGTLSAGKKILQAEELISTTATLLKVYEAVQSQNEFSLNFLPVVGTIIHRPPALPAVYEGLQIVSLVEVAVFAVEQDKCPLCKLGSKRVRPKENWHELMKRISNHTS